MKLMIVFWILISISCAFGQSYLIMENGIILTTDNSGFVYDFGHFSYPQKITLRGGQYFVEEENILATIDENGQLFRKYELIPEKIRGKGINYFISDDGILFAIDRKGFVKISDSEKYKHSLNFGGNFFTLLDPDSGETELYVVTSEGVVQHADLSGLKVKDIISFGGTYFMTNRGSVYTVSHSGVVSSQENFRIGIINKKGGNYFIDSSNFFYTVDENGKLETPSLPISLRPGNILRHGTNYFIDQQGRFFVVDKTGAVFERILRDQDFRLTKIISL